MDYASGYDVGSNNHARFAQVLEKFLDQTQTSLDAHNRYGIPLLHMAVENSDHGIIKTLLDSGANVNVENSEKLSPIGLFYERVKGNPSTLHCGKNLDCFIALVAHVERMMMTKSFLTDNLLKHFKELSKLYPKKFAVIESSTRNEIELMTSKIIDDRTSLLSILSKNPDDMVNYAKNEVLKRIIESPEFSICYPLFGSRLVYQFKIGSRRGLIIMGAKKALELITARTWPESCDGTFHKRVKHDSHLLNEPLQKLMKFS
ncbi:hypothetical protein QAD02_015444 [Eretmocerus hayati]|uniref:Uncharacterized protein n=1 Tax=Eretmocerus hayati TaxID=131215 RepID=A0ACC2P8N1_9HYME|nr:hypothetical protein QAD02_015444 [Eretmocerus hayati]